MSLICRLAKFVGQGFRAEALGLAGAQASRADHLPDARLRRRPGFGIALEIFERRSVALGLVDVDAAERLVGEGIVERARARPDMLDLILSLPEQGLEADALAGIRIDLAAFAPQQPFLDQLVGGVGDPVGDQAGARGAALAFALAHAARALLALGGGEADLARDFQPYQIGLAVELDQIVDDLAQFVLHAHDGRVPQASDAPLLLGMPRRRRGQPVQDFAGRTVAVGEIRVAPILPVRRIEQRAEARARARVRAGNDAGPCWNRAPSPAGNAA